MEGAPQAATALGMAEEGGGLPYVAIHAASCVEVSHERALWGPEGGTNVPTKSIRRAIEVICVQKLDKQKTALHWLESCEEEKVDSKLRYRSSIHCIYPVRTRGL